MALDIGHKAFEREVRRARVEGRPTPTVAIVGGGLSGLATAIQLVRAGVRSFTVIEQSDGVGGTWRDNVYPGAACDVPSHLYSFSFAPKTDWSRRFADQPEILAYAEDLVDRYHLAPHLRLGTTVRSARYDEASGTWRLDLHADAGDDELEADTVVFACGQLNRPHLPDVEGVDSFAGPVVALGPVGPLRGPRRQAGGRGRHRGQRHPVRAPGGRGGGQHHHLPAQPQLRRARRRTTPTRPAPGRALRADRPAAVGLPVVDLLDPRDALAVVPPGQLRRQAARRPCSARGSGTRS